MDISSSVALVSGGATGLGLATVAALAESGARIVAFDRNENGASAVAPFGALFVWGDATDTRSVVEAVETARRLGPLRAVVNCIGISTAIPTVGRDETYDTAHDLDAFMHVVTVNLCGTFNVCRIAATAMAMLEPDQAGERGAIVNTASVAAFEGRAGQTAYSASTGGIVSLTVPLARDLAPLSIRVNTIASDTLDAPPLSPDSEPRPASLSLPLPFLTQSGLPGEFASMVLQLLTNTNVNAETVRLHGDLRPLP